MATAMALWALTHSTGPMVVVWTMGIGLFVAALFPISLAMGSDVADRIGLSNAFSSFAFLGALLALALPERRHDVIDLPADEQDLYQDLAP